MLLSCFSLFLLLTKNFRRAHSDGRDSNSDMQNLSKLVQDHQPRAIIVAAENLECRRYLEDIQGIVTRLKGSRELRKVCKVLYGDAELARAFKQSQRGIAGTYFFLLYYFPSFVIV